MSANDHLSHPRATRLSRASGLLALMVLASGAGAPARAQAAPELAPRLFVLSDIGNEPDDQMSLVRLVLYSDVIDIEGFGAVTSVWQRDSVRPDIARTVIAAYGKVVGNLRQHDRAYPDAADLAARVSAGVPGYGHRAIDAVHPSPAALALEAAALRPDSRPLWVALWGGANTLEEMLAHAQAHLSADAFAALVGRLRVYAIADQDDSGAIIRRTWPGLFWIGTPSSPDGGDYARMTWTGISGDAFYRNGAGADRTTVSNAWLDRNIRAKGPLGAAYPQYKFIMEGDTPSFLGLVPNGLDHAETPGWGGWGGRYVLRTPAGETRALWTQGGDSFMRVTSADSVAVAGVTHVSDQATIWRWRTAFQNDFAARMDWTVQPYGKANHPPQPVVDGIAGLAPITIHAHTGQTLHPDAGGSRDPDGQALSFHWFAYDEAGFDGRAPDPVLTIARADSARPDVTIAARCGAMWLDLLQLPCPASRVAHLIVAVTDTGSPALTRYRRVLIEVSDP